MGPRDSLDSIPMGPAANLCVQNTSFQNTMLQNHCILGSTKIETASQRPIYEYRMQDAQDKTHSNHHRNRSLGILVYGCGKIRIKCLVPLYVLSDTLVLLVVGLDVVLGASLCMYDCSLTPSMYDLSLYAIKLCLCSLHRTCFLFNLA